MLSAIDKISFPHSDICKHKLISMLDSEDQDVLSVFEESNKYIHEAIQAGGKVLVHW